MAVKQGIVVGTDVFWECLFELYLDEHQTDRKARGIATVYSKPNDASRVLIQYDHDPMAFQHDGFASKKVDAPEVISQMADKRQPGRTVITGKMFRVISKNSAHRKSADFDAEGLIDLHGNALIAKAWILAFHFENELNNFIIGTGPAGCFS